MPCEIWVRGYGAELYSGDARNYLSNATSSYIEFYVSTPTIAPTAPISLVPTRVNPGATNFSYDLYYQANSATRLAYPNGMWDTHRPPEYFYKGSCPPAVLPTALDPSQPHDCINGNCLPASVYKTPGFFRNFSECQASCAKNSNCTGICVDLAELDALQTAADNVRSRICK